MKTTSGGRPERCNIRTKADGGIDVKVDSLMIGSEYGIEWKNSALLNGRNKIRRYEDIVKAFATARVFTCLVGTMSTSDGVAEMCLVIMRSRPLTLSPMLSLKSPASMIE